MADVSFNKTFTYPTGQTITITDLSEHAPTCDAEGTIMFRLDYLGLTKTYSIAGAALASMSAEANYRWQENIVQDFYGSVVMSRSQFLPGKDGHYYADSAHTVALFKQENDALRAELAEARARIAELEETLQDMLETYQAEHQEEAPSVAPGAETPGCGTASASCANNSLTYTYGSDGKWHVTGQI